MQDVHSGIEHEPWVGKSYTEGINGSRIAIVLHSHYYGDPKEECANFTTSIIEDLIAGKRADQNLVKLQKYFGVPDAASFWYRVIFFNFLPNCIGTEKNMRERGTPGQIKTGKERFLRIIFNHNINKVFVFSRRAWRCCPKTIEEEATNGRPLLLGSGFSAFYEYGSYLRNDHKVRAYGLEHPERAPSDRLTRAVQFIMAIP